jgi:maltose O-acetyltransferase
VLLVRSIHAVLRAVYNRWLRPDPLEELKARGLVVGVNLNVMRDVSIDWSHCWHITIGDDVTLAPRVQILAHDASTKLHLGYTRIGKVDIGDRVFIGASSVILPGVRIGSDVVIGAGSIVTRDIPDGVVAAGNPARPVCALEEWLERKRGEMSFAPRFGEEYTLRQNVAPAMRTEMNDRMVDRIGYIA